MERHAFTKITHPFFIISEDIDLIMCYSDVAALFFSVYHTYQWNQNKIMQHGFLLKHSWKYCKILIMAENVSKYMCQISKMTYNHFNMFKHNK